MKSSLPGTLAAALLIAVGAARIYAAVVQSSTDVPKAIPDDNSSGVNSTLFFEIAGTITDVNLTVDISHTWNDDVEVRLSSPSVAQQLLLQDCGGSGDNTTATLDQQAAGLNTCTNGGTITGTFQPTDGSGVSPVATSGSLNAFNGNFSGGVWTLNVTDDSPICTGTLNAWSLTIDGPGPLPVELMSFAVE